MACCAVLFTSAQPDEDVYINYTEANRTITPSYRIADKPSVVDTVVPIPNINYPLLSRTMTTEISIDDIEASKVRIVPKLDKLYPSYMRLGIGNYANPLGEFYFNSVRDRRTAYGVHINHHSAFRNINNYAPSTFDDTQAKLFGEFFTSRFKIESQIDYLNNGYHYYGIQDSTDAISSDSVRNRVQGIAGNFRFSNFERRDSAKLLYTIHTTYDYFHEFDRDEANLNARNTNFIIGTEMAYKLKAQVYTAAFAVKYNKYKFADGNPNVLADFWYNNNNTIIQLKPVISSYGDKWKVTYGVDLNFDIVSDEPFKAVPIIEGKYSLFNDMFIPYAGIGGGVKQNTFKTLNRFNPFINSELELRNTRELKFYGGIKGTLSKTLSFNAQVHSTTFSGLPLFVNDTASSIWSDYYQFDVIYDKVSAFGINGSISYQSAEKLKIDLIAAYNRYSGVNEVYVWNLPAIDITFRGSYNLYDKIYVKTDLQFLGGRRNPEGLFVTDATDEDFDLGFVADANLHLEYRYNKRVSAFLQFNNLAAQKYFRWNRYPVQGFQVLGGATFGF